MDYPRRKPLRLKHYDYAANGAYFVTICTHDKACLFGEIVGEGFHPLPSRPYMALSPIGVEVEKSIQFIDEKYDCIDKYVVMPNHIHMMVSLDQLERHHNISLQDVVGRIKSYTTKQYSQISGVEKIHLWQRSYHDHVIRSECDYLEIWQYIDNNPLKWELDKYHNK